MKMQISTNAKVNDYEFATYTNFLLRSPFFMFVESTKIIDTSVYN